VSDRVASGNAAVRVVQVADPAAEAARVAAEVGGDVAGDVQSAERAVRARVEAGRQLAAGNPAQDEAALARADAIRAAAAAAPPISDDDVEELRHLAADLGRAARIRTRTESRIAEVLQARVAASTGVAIHPAAIATAADAVRDAEAALAAAERGIADLGPQPELVDDDPHPGLHVDDPVLRQPHDDFDEAHLERRRGVLRAVALVLVVAIAAGVALAAGAPIIVVPIGAVFAVAFCVLALTRGRRAAGRVDREGTALEVMARTVESTGSGRKLASLDARDQWVGQRARLDAARDEAEERLRVALNRWHQLAGAGADPHDPDAVIRAHDPQLAYDGRVAEASPTVRTVAAFHRRAQARWKVMWATLGRPEPAAEDLDAVLDEVLAEHRAAQDALAALEAAEARVEAAAVVRRPLVLVEPRSWMAPGRLSQLVASVPPQGEVVLVERGGPGPS
jgi:Flp pilus assembly protein TadB